MKEESPGICIYLKVIAALSLASGIGLIFKAVAFDTPYDLYTGLVIIFGSVPALLWMSSVVDLLHTIALNSHRQNQRATTSLPLTKKDLEGMINIPTQTAPASKATPKIDSDKPPVYEL